MNISAVNNIDTNSITSQINDMTLGKTNTTENFSDVLSSMMNSIDETNDLQNTAEEKESLLLARQKIHMICLWQRQKLLQHYNTQLQ